MVDLVVRVRFIHLFGKVWWEFCNSIYVLRKKTGEGGVAERFTPGEGNGLD